MKKLQSPILKRILKDIKTFGAGILAYLIYHFVALHFLGASCPLYLFVGIPCPGCGMTRAIAMVLTLQFDKAIYLNPVAFGWVLLIILFIIFRYFVGKIPKWLKVLFWIVVGLTFIRYIYGMINYYPNRIPYVRNYRTVFKRIVNR